MENSLNIQQALFFSFLKKPGLKPKKVININYLIIALIQNEAIEFLDFSQYVLACRYVTNANQARL